MGLEIEFDYDDTQDGQWSPPQQAQPLGERVGRRWGAVLTAGNPLFVHVAIGLAALVLGAASTAGFLQGRAAAENRATTRLHLAPLDAFVVEPLPRQAALSPADLLATPWTNAFDRHVTLSVVNDGPDPVSVLSAQVTAPQFGTASLVPVVPAVPVVPSGTAATSSTAAMTTGPGSTSTLRGVAHVVCGDYTSVDTAATVAHIAVRTADGRTRVQTLMVDRFSEVQEAAVCDAMPAPQTVTGTKIVPSVARGTYTYVADVTNRAPYPLLVAMPSNVVQDWRSTAGLILQPPPPMTIPPHGRNSVPIRVTISSCTLALESASYGFDSLAFTDARDGPDNPLARVSDQVLDLNDPSMLKTYCGRLQLPGLSEGGSGG